MEPVEEKDKSPFLDTTLCYKMTAKPRGLCLIINNVDYDAEKHEKRTHSDFDADRLQQTFEQLLHFVVYKEVNLTAYQMLNFLRDNAKKVTKNHDALVVIVLTHGYDSDHLIGIDNNLIKTPDILNFFSSKNCPNLINKPKLFFIEACRGKSTSMGVRRTSADGRASIIQPNDIRETPERLNAFKKLKDPSFQDMLIAYSTVPDCTSLYNDSGSWYCTQLNHHLQKSAASKDIQQILMDVDKSIRDMEMGDGIKQTSCYENRGLYKKLYFNPGYYEIAKENVESTSE